MPATLLLPARQAVFTDALMAASRYWGVEMHFQKGLAGAPEELVAATRSTPMNPAVTEAFMLAIIASEGPPAFPGPPVTPRMSPKRGATPYASTRPRPSWRN